MRLNKLVSCPIPTFSWLKLTQISATTNEQHAIVEVIVSMLANLGIEVEGCEVEDGCEEGGSTQNDELKYFPRPNWDGNIWK